MGSGTSAPTSLRKSGENPQEKNNRCFFWGGKSLGTNCSVRPSLGILGRGNFTPSRDILTRQFSDFHPNFTPGHHKNPPKPPKSPLWGVPALRRVFGNLGILGCAAPCPPKGVKLLGIGSSLEFSSWFLRHPKKKLSGMKKKLLRDGPALFFGEGLGGILGGIPSSHPLCSLADPPNSSSSSSSSSSQPVSLFGPSPGKSLPPPFLLFLRFLLSPPGRKMSGEGGKLKINPPGVWGGVSRDTLGTPRAVLGLPKVDLGS